jgi:hypothetical protein
MPISRLASKKKKRIDVFGLVLVLDVSLPGLSGQSRFLELITRTSRIMTEKRGIEAT